MGRKSNKRYRSYREKKTQSKRFRTYFVRFLFMILFYSIFTMFIAISVGVKTDSMAPNLTNGNTIIIQPTKSLYSLLQHKNGRSFKRGDIVTTGTNYIVEPSILEIILDPVVRIFTLQKKSLIYDNSEYKGRGELLRVVGLPGDTVKIKDSTVYIKAEGQDFFLSEFEMSSVDYDISKKVPSANWNNEYPFSSELDEVSINDDHYFLVSDNRGVMNDSRVFGSINQDFIIGKVILKYWPLNEFSFY